MSVCQQWTFIDSQTKQQYENLLRSGRPRVTSDRDDRALQSLVRRMPIATSPVLKQHWWILCHVLKFQPRRAKHHVKRDRRCRSTNSGCLIHKNTAYTPRNIQPTVPYGGGSVMIWGCISHDCKLDLVPIQGNLTGDRYIKDVLQPVVVPHSITTH
jgi:hypothetical protein